MEKEEILKLYLTLKGTNGRGGHSERQDENTSKLINRINNNEQKLTPLIKFTKTFILNGINKKVEHNTS